MRTDDNPVTMTIAEYATHRGVTPKAVREALRRGRIAFEDEDARTIDPVIADEEWQANTSQGHARPNGRRGNPQSGSMADANARRTEAYASYLELKTAKLAETLVDREQTELVVSTLAMQFRDGFMQFCQRIAPLAAHDCGGDPGKLRRFLDTACREELTRMATGAINLKKDNPHVEE